MNGITRIHVAGVSSFVANRFDTHGRVSALRCSDDATPKTPADR
jgi:hypothetical protein